MNETKPFCTDTALCGYMPLPRQVLTFQLSSTAMVLYAALLDRATLSQKNRLCDLAGQVYVVYPIEHLAETLGKGKTAIKSCLKELSHAGLIDVRQPVKNRPNQIYLNIPADGIQAPEVSGNRPLMGRKTAPSGVGKPPPNNLTQQPNKNNYYQHREEESL